MTDNDIDHDRHFKQLIETFFWEFIELFIPEVLAYVEKESLDFMPQEILTDITSGDKKIIDILAQVKMKEEEVFFLIHIETQASSKSDFAERMFKYFARLHEKYQLPIYPVALFSFDSPYREESNVYELSFPDRQVLYFSFKSIQLNRLNWKEYLKNPNPVAAALMTKMRIPENERLRVKCECLRMLASLRLNPAKIELILNFLETYLKLNQEENEVYKSELEAIESSQRGAIMTVMNRLVEEGIEQGIDRGKRILALELLNYKFGSSSSKFEERINNLSLENIENLAKSLLDFTTEEDLENWLNNH